jgi:hypothetical protein
MPATRLLRKGTTVLSAVLSTEACVVVENREENFEN